MMKKIKRRSFIKSAAAISTFTVIKPEIAFGSKINSAVRVGIIGCGNRGSAVLSDMVKHTNSVTIAMADLFKNNLESKLGRYNGFNSDKKLPGIPDSNLYTGSKAYKRLLDNKDVDAVIISSPAYTHADFLEASVKAGKHIYCEKPVAPDVEGCLRVEKAGNKAEGKMSIAIGFQIRHATPYKGMVERIRRGDIGEIINVQLYYLSSGVRKKHIGNMTDDEIRIRNHFQFRELSGGILLDQGIHMLDVCNWALGPTPIKAIGSGNMKGRGEFGNCWTNFQAIYNLPENINVTILSTHFGKKSGGVCARFLGTEGIAEAHYNGGVFINGDNEWDSGILRYGTQEPTPEQRRAGIFLSSLYDSTPNKVKNFISSIESGNFINETKSASQSTLMAIMGREAAFSGKQLSWDELKNSGNKLDPMLNLKQFD